MVIQPNINQTKKHLELIFRQTDFKPTAFLQGNPEFNLTNLPQPKKRPFYKHSTVLYEGNYQNQKAVLKVIVNPTNNWERFQRELYAYQTLGKQFPLWQNHIASLYASAELPLGYLIMQKIEGKNLGDWYLFNPLEQVNFEKILATVVTLHKQIKVAPQYQFKPVANYNHNLTFSADQKQSLKLLSPALTAKMNHLMERYKKQYSNRWQKFFSGFIFGDLSPSNIYLDLQNQIKFLDLETISQGLLTADLSLLYFAAIGCKAEKNILQLIRQTSKQAGQLELLDFFVYCQILTNAHKLAKVTHHKYQRLLEYLVQQY